MSGGKVSLPPELSELLTTTVVWESWDGEDGHGQSIYADPVTKSCWIEPHGTMSGSGGITALRTSSIAAIDPHVDIYFPGDDVDAQTFTLLDRFTVTQPGTRTGPMPEQATQIASFLGPNFNNRNPWLIVVTI